MSTNSFSPTQVIFQDFLGKFHSRKLLISNHLDHHGHQPTSSPPPYASESRLDSHVVIVLSVLVCGVICSLGLHFLIRCALMSCSRLVYSESRANSSTPLAKAGVNKKVLKTFPVVKYSSEMLNLLPGLDTECVICLTDFAVGENVKMLPKCNHGFHVRCIDKWLMSHSSCPKCRHCLIETSKKIVGSGQQAAVTSSSSETLTVFPVQESVVSIRTLESEGIIRPNC